MRLAWPAVVGGTLVLALGAAGLVRGAVPQSAAQDNTSPQPLTVTGAYVRPPAPPNDTAAAYFVVRNNTGKAERLIGVTTGAGSSATLHMDENGRMVALATGADIPARGTLTLSVGTKHVMISGLYGPLRGGDRVNIALTFEHSPDVTVDAPVVPFGTDPPAGGTPS